jgi:magnesium and cobalt exporter, CNNM family
MVADLILLVLLILCSGFFSGSETALFSLSQVKLSQYKQSDDRREKLIARLLGRPQKLLITIILGNLVVNILASSVSVSLFRALEVSGAETISALAMMLLIITFGEITPKTIAIERSGPLSKLVTPAIHLFSKVIMPLQAAVLAISNLFIRGSAHTPTGDEALTDAEFRTAVKMGLTEGVLDERERDMIHGVLDIDSKQVREIMKPSVEIFALPVETPFEEVCRAIQSTEYTRIPMYDGDIDHVAGILYAKDLLYTGSEELDKTGLRRILRRVFYVPETMSIGKLMDEFKKRKMHLALAVDEYGSIGGLITLEDLLEMIVGDIDSKRFETRHYHFLAHDRMRISSRLSLDKFNEIFSTSLEDELSVTVGGFLTHRLGRIPVAGEIFEHDKIRFEVTRAHKHRIDELVVSTIKQGQKTLSKEELK